MEWNVGTGSFLDFLPCLSGTGSGHLHCGNDPKTLRRFICCMWCVGWTAAMKPQFTDQLQISKCYKLLKEFNWQTWCLTKRLFVCSQFAFAQYSDEIIFISADQLIKTNISRDFTSRWWNGDTSSTPTIQWETRATKGTHDNECQCVDARKWRTRATSVSHQNLLFEWMCSVCFFCQSMYH